MGFTHYLGTSRQGKNVVQRKTSAKRFSRWLKAIKEWWGWKHRHLPFKEQINGKLTGQNGYYGISATTR